jgi:hypothetical protein
MALTSARQRQTPGTPVLDGENTLLTRTRRPAVVSVEAHELDGTRIELAALRHDAIAHCDFVEPRLDMLYPIAIELDPRAEQLVGGCLYSVARLRRQATA